MNARDRSLIGMLALVLVAVLGYFLLVAPPRARADKLTHRITAAQAALGQAEVRLTAGQAAETRYLSYARQLKVIDRAVPSDAQIPGLINELQSAATENHVDFQTLSTGAAPAASPSATTTATSSALPSQSFALSFTGSYYSVADLLGTLDSFVRADDSHFEARGRLLSISSVSLSPGATGDGDVSSTGSGDVTASVTALDYDLPSTLSGSSPSTASATG